MNSFDNPFLSESVRKRWTDDERYIYDERVAIMCEDGPITREAHQEAMNNVAGYRSRFKAAKKGKANE